MGEGIWSEGFCHTIRQLSIGQEGCGKSLFATIDTPLIEFVHEVGNSERVIVTTSHKPGSPDHILIFRGQK
jgi:hypothetical protein